MHSFQTFIVRLIPNHPPPLETRIWKLVVRALVELHKQMWRVNNKGRCFPNGKPISPNKRCNIIEETKSKGGDKDTVFSRGVLLM